MHMDVAEQGLAQLLIVLAGLTFFCSFEGMRGCGDEGHYEQRADSSRCYRVHHWKSPIQLERAASSSIGVA